tara:strand:- start:12 stop:449 length:438 start_codon:yes stop_codon:yes gene_type:complete
MTIEMNRRMDVLGGLIEEARKSGQRGDGTKYDEFVARARALVDECGTEVMKFYDGKVEPKLREARRKGLPMERERKLGDAFEGLLHVDYRRVIESLARVAHINERLNGSPLRGLAYEYAQSVSQLVDRAKEKVASGLEKVTGYKR